MTTDTKETTAQEGQTGTPIQDTQSQPKPEAAPSAEQTVNWEERARDLQTQLTKLDSDLKAARGRNKPIESLETRIAALQEDLAGMRQGLLLVGKALDSGETGKVATEIEQLQQQTVGRSVLAQLQRDTIQALEEAALGEDGEPLFDINAVPELNDIRVEYNEALKGKNPMALSLAATKALPIINRLRAKVGQEKVSKTVATAVKDAEEKAKKEYQAKMVAMGGLPEPIGGAGAPAGDTLSLEELAKVDTRGMSPRQLAEHDKKLDVALRKGR